MNRLTTCAIVVLATITAEADDFNANEFGVNLGWGAPYGFSIQYQRNFDSSNSVGTGIGISMSGGRLGLDYKRFFATENKFNPYLGFATSLASGLPEMTVAVNGDSSLYKVNSGVQATPRGGSRYQLSSVNWYFNVGYGFPISGGGVKYLSGSQKSANETAAKIVSVGGLEVSGSLYWKF